MAGSSLLLLIDDIAALLDDVAVMTKVAVKKTSGVLGDDLALNAQQVSGVSAERELPVVWAVAKGSLLNKAILVPAALLISVFLPVIITPLLMLGGGFLCFEGTEKVIHSLFHKQENKNEQQNRLKAIAEKAVDMVAFEKDKIKGAIRTDFILSAEIIVIALGTVAAEPLLKQSLVLVSIALLITVGVYGLVAGIVKLDDAGLYLSRIQGDHIKGRLTRKLGHSLVIGAPYLMKFLSIAGTAAMFLVGGGILVHGVSFLHHGIEHISHLAVTGSAIIDAILNLLVPSLLTAIAGFIAGGIILLGVTAVQKVLPKKA